MKHGRISDLKDLHKNREPASACCRQVVHLFVGACEESLVTGQYGVSDSHLVASSFYKDTLYSDAPFRARINTEPEVIEDKEGPDVTLGGGWLAKTSDKKQWIQVSICYCLFKVPYRVQ